MKDKIKLDSLGRIVIPVHIRNELGIKGGDTLEISLSRGTISIYPLKPICLLCGKKLSFNTKPPVCSDCKIKLINS